ncbi:threonine aldolase family protein [Motiliproteus coralliicola]|nr:GntG family PLP-dependent aldolase [Motiliproteus coralliicola]
MLEAMTRATYDDDVRQEDGRTFQLEQHIAQMFGKADAMLTATGTAANFIAMLHHCGRGDEFIIGADYHIYGQECGGAMALGGAVGRTVPVTPDGGLDIGDIIPQRDLLFKPPTTLVCLENTHRGRPLDANRMAEMCDRAKSFGLSVHLDGARIWNAHVATGDTLADLVAGCDTIMVCLNKGLGCPSGAMLLGSKEAIKRCRGIRKMIGGAIRQPGLYVAAVEYALTHNIDRLKRDHDEAKRLAEKHGGEWTGTNMVFFPPYFSVNGIQGDRAPDHTRWVIHSTP